MGGGAKGVFNGLKVAVPNIGVNAVGQAVSKFDTALQAGALDAAYSNFAVSSK